MARGKGIVPHWYLPSFEEIDLDVLRSLGIKGIILDLDNTLVPGGKNEVPPDVKAWLKRATEKGFKLCIFSNTVWIKRLARISGETGIPYIVGSLKPRRGGIRKALDFIGVKPQESVMIGDRVLTDVWGGNRMGMWTILLEPLKGGKGLATNIFWHLEHFLLHLVGLREPINDSFRQNI